MTSAQAAATSSNSATPVLYGSCCSRSLRGTPLAAMNDPVGSASRFAPCSCPARKTDALSKLSTTATRACKALDAYQESKNDTAFYYLDLLFGGQFPSR